ncbi:MAG TPA: beta-1,6-N-acetylglucosaminyltransferase [Novosphingobium sp.]|nr:beta-1,6-N-acetylglucosaminyltransferase [Novosphingobium sp.]
MKRNDAIAGLLLCHEPSAERILERAGILAGAVDHLFIHYDGRAPEEVFTRLQAGAANLPRITVLDTRIGVHWGGDDMVEAMLLLLGAAAGAGDFAYFAFLSTSHYPLRDAADARATLEAMLRGKSGLEAKPMPARQVLLRLVIPFDKTKRRSHLGPSGLMRNLATLVRLVARHGRPHWGSQWMVISRADLPALGGLRNRLREGEFASWKIPDEVLLQTVLRSSREPYLSTYFEFDPANTGSPRTLDPAAVSRLKAADTAHLFARKVP